MQIMVKQWPELVEASSRYDPPKSILVPPEKTKKSPFWGHFRECRNRDMWEITRSQKVELARPVCRQRAWYMMQIMVKQGPEMVEGSSRYDPQKSILVPPKKDQKTTILGSFSGLSEPWYVGEYKKPESRASPASMSSESLIHDANYGETMAWNG